MAGHLLRPMLRLGVVQTAVFRLFSQTWIGYRGSPAVGGASGRGGVRPGDRAPHGGPPSGLRHQVLLSGNAEPGWHRSVESVASRYRVELPVRPEPVGDRTMGRPFRARAPWLVLVRPDGHVAFAGADPVAFGAYLDRRYVRR